MPSEAKLPLMSSSLIPCTVQILSRNTAHVIGKCLDSLRSFAEVIVHDGYSSDGTRDIAAKYPNVTILDQDQAHLNEEGRITDFSKIRNQSMEAATYNWILVVDADEHIGVDLEREVREIVERDVPGVYQVFRQFYVNGEKIMHCAGYPTYQIRMFHRSAVNGYVKSIHEKLVLKPGVTKQILKTEIAVPLPPAHELETKYRRYLLMEARRQGVMPWGKWFKWVFFRNLRSILGLTLLTLATRLTPKRGKRMPVVYEWQAIRHSFQVILYTFPPRVRRTLR